mgnify:CR=1 FL=1
MYVCEYFLIPFACNFLEKNDLWLCQCSILKSGSKPIVFLGKHSAKMKSLDVFSWEHGNFQYVAFKNYFWKFWEKLQVCATSKIMKTKWNIQANNTYSNKLYTYCSNTDQYMVHSWRSSCSICSLQLRYHFFVGQLLLYF